jgi:uncharacterized protein with beta-barrel porin domain
MKIILSAIAVLIQLNLFAQEPLSVTDESPVTVNGLKAGYSITNETEKEVGSKGNFSRFQVQFYVTNTSKNFIAQTGLYYTWQRNISQSRPI